MPNGTASGSVDMSMDKRKCTEDLPTDQLRGHGLGRSCSRTVFTRAQLDAMEDRFVRQPFLTREERIELAEQIQLTERQILVWFQNRRGRLKRKGPADKAYERKQYYKRVAPDARWRAFPAGVTCAEQSDKPETFADTDNRISSTQNADSVNKFIQPLGDNVSMTWSGLPGEESQKVPVENHTAMDNGRVHQLQKHQTEFTANNSDIVQQRHLVVSQSVVDEYYDSAWVASTSKEQPFYYKQSCHDSGNATTACPWERGPTRWKALDQSYRPQQLVTCRPHSNEASTGGLPTSASFWPADSPTILPNYNSFQGSSYHCGSTPSDNTGWSYLSSTDQWSDCKMAYNWSSTSPNTASSGSVNPCQYYQTAAPNTFQFL